MPIGTLEEAWKTPYLRGTDFTAYTNLTGLDFSNRDLAGADFSGCDLTGATFANSNLSYALFNGSTCKEVNLFRTTMVQTDFTGADCTRASFQWAYLSSVVMTNATVLTGTSWDHASLINTAVPSSFSELTTFCNFYAKDITTLPA